MKLQMGRIKRKTKLNPNTFSHRYDLKKKHLHTDTVVMETY